MDINTFQDLYERVAPNLLAYLRYSCRNGDLAKDLLQETFLRVLQAAPKNFDATGMRAYLYKTAKSALNDHWRKHRRERRLQEEHAALGEPIAPPDGELSQDMLRLLAELSERARTLLWLAYVEGFPHREIAELVGVREKGVRVMLLRARRDLAQRLAREGMQPNEDTR